MEIITTHTNADFDTLASMVAARKLYPGAVIVFPGATEKSIRKFFEEFPAFRFDHTRVKNIDMEKIERLIIVDTRQKSRVGPFADILDRPGLDIHIFDHHPASADDIKGNFEVTSTYGSNTTLMVEALRKKKFSITPLEATVMMIGIYEDTGSLLFVSTTEDDFIAAAYLLSKGADLRTVSDFIKREMTTDEIRLLNDLNSNAMYHRINGQEIVITTSSSENYIDDAAHMAHKMMEINKIDALFALMRMRNRIYLVARSRVKEVNAAEIAAAFGGGGHGAAASAAIKGITLIEAESRLREVLKGKIRPIRTAKEIMSSPVKFISPDDSLKHAKEIMSKYNINVLPAVENDRLSGLISRQDVGKAIFHGLERRKVKEFMNTDYFSVEIGSPLLKVQEIIIERNQKFLPVMSGRKLVGCITRTDILRALHFDAKIAKGRFNEIVHKKNLKGVIRGRLPGWLQSILKAAGVQADKSGVNAYLVGGFVRDLLLNRKNLDVDIVVDGEGIKYAEGLAAALGGRLKSHRKFGTAVIVLPDGFKLDVASARMEFYKTPAALPTVEAGPIKMDLYRRDFTINSMAIKLNQKSFGELIDYFGGLRDVKEKAIRVLHSLSFIEDPTRAFRAVRFEKRLGFHIGGQSLGLIKNAVRLDFFDKVSPSRIFNELKIALAEDNAMQTVKRMEQLDILRFIHPKFKITPVEENLFSEIGKVFDWYDLLFKNDVYERWLILLAALQTPLQVFEIEEMAGKCCMTARERDALLEIKETGAETMEVLGAERLDNCSIYHHLRPLRLETLLFIMADTKDSAVKERISLFITELDNVKAGITGKELKSLGIAPGPVYTVIKRAIIDERLKGRIFSREDEIAYIIKRWKGEHWAKG